MYSSTFMRCGFSVCQDYPKLKQSTSTSDRFVVQSWDNWQEYLCLSEGSPLEDGEIHSPLLQVSRLGNIELVNHIN